MRLREHQPGCPLEPRARRLVIGLREQHIAVQVERVVVRGRLEPACFESGLGARQQDLGRHASALRTHLRDRGFEGLPLHQVHDQRHDQDQQAGGGAVPVSPLDSWRQLGHGRQQRSHDARLLAALRVAADGCQAGWFGDSGLYMSETQPFADRAKRGASVCRPVATTTTSGNCRVTWPTRPIG